MQEQTLWTDHTRAITVNIAWDEVWGWSLSIASTMSDCSWPSDAWTHYERLSIAELTQVLNEELYKRA